MQREYEIEKESADSSGPTPLPIPIEVDPHFSGVCAVFDLEACRAEEEGRKQRDWEELMEEEEFINRYWDVRGGLEESSSGADRTHDSNSD